MERRPAPMKFIGVQGVSAFPFPSPEFLWKSNAGYSRAGILPEGDKVSRRFAGRLLTAPVGAE